MHGSLVSNGNWFYSWKITFDYSCGEAQAYIPRYNNGGCNGTASYQHPSQELYCCENCMV